MKAFSRLVFIVLLLVAVAGVLPLAAQEPSSLPDYMTENGLDVTTLNLVGDQPFEPTHDDCAVDGFGFRLDGQVYLISGGAGGLVVDPNKQDARAGSTAGEFAETQLSSGTLKALIPSTVTTATPGNENVALLIVDNFPPTVSLQSLFDISKNIALTDEQKNIALTTPTIPHGALVYNFVNEMLLQSNFALSGGDEQSADWKSPSSNAVFRVKAVHTNGYQTNLIATAISQAIAEVQSDPDTQFQRIVVNMSFAILSCDVVNDVVDSNSENSQDYLLQLSGKNLTLLSDYMTAAGFPLPEPEVQEHLDQLRQALNSSLADYIAKLQEDDNYRLIDEFHQGLIQLLHQLTNPNDPLLNMINEYKGQSIMFIASAGNDGAAFSYYPALWKEVLSVSAFEKDQIGRAYWSNAGEAIEQGAWFALTDPLGLYNGGDPVPVFFKGTSFSAPVMSVLAAMKFSNTPPCQDNSVIESTYDGFMNGFHDTESTIALNDIFVNMSVPPC